MPKSCLTFQHCALQRCHRQSRRRLRNHRELLSEHIPLPRFLCSHSLDKDSPHCCINKFGYPSSIPVESYVVSSLCGRSATPRWVGIINRLPHTLACIQTFPTTTDLCQNSSMRCCSRARLLPQPRSDAASRNASRAQKLVPGRKWQLYSVSLFLGQGRPCF